MTTGAIIGLAIGITTTVAILLATLCFFLPTQPNNQKKTYIIYYEENTGSKSTMLIDKHSPQEAIKAFYRTFGKKTCYQIVNIVEAEEVFEILRQG